MSGLGIGWVEDPSFHHPEQEPPAPPQQPRKAGRDDPWLADVQATTRRISCALGTSSDPSVYGDHCVNCAERWCLPADKASCAHTSICEDCWPNGCEVCEQSVEDGIRHREQATTRILNAALELRTGADDLSEADLRQLNWIIRKDVLRHVDLSIEALRRVADTLNAQDRGTL